MNNKTLNIKIPDVLYESIQQKAKSKNISMASLIRLILTEYLENEQKK